MTTDNNPKAALLPCPFCGCGDIQHYSRSDASEQCVMRCLNPGCRAQVDASSDRAVVNAWNRRSPSAVSEGDAWRYCWLIERQIDQRAAWRSMTSFLPCAGWTLDANEALWFARQKDAEDFMRADAGDGEIYTATAIEHGFAINSARAKEKRNG